MISSLTLGAGSVPSIRPTAARQLQAWLLIPCLASWAFTAAAQNASAILSGQPAGGGLFDYTITLDNHASSPPIGVFWYASRGAVGNLLPSMPASPVPAPSGWSVAVTHLGAGDGYGIEWVANNLASQIASGQSLDFNFESMDSPAALAGNSPFFPISVGFSDIAGFNFSTFNQGIFVTSVPEPSAACLWLLGALLFLVRPSRHRGPFRFGSAKPKGF